MHASSTFSFSTESLLSPVPSSAPRRDHVAVTSVAPTLLSPPHVVFGAQVAVVVVIRTLVVIRALVVVISTHGFVGFQVVGERRATSTKRSAITTDPVGAAVGVVHT